jgi:hypothetical protein
VSDLPTGDPAAVAVALEQIRGTMATGFASIDGKLALLAQRGDQNDRRLEAVEARLDVIERGETEQQKRTGSRLDELEANRWPWRTICALSAVAGAVAAVVALWQH